MHLPSLGKWFCASLFAVVLTACGGGSDGQDEPAEPVAINAMGVDGPLLNAQVEVFTLADYIINGENSTSLLLSDAPVRSDASTGLIDNLTLSITSVLDALVLVVTADANTIDLTTGEAPVVTQVVTVIRDLDIYEPVFNPANSSYDLFRRHYATPLTSLALGQAIEVATANNELTELGVLGELNNAQRAVKNLFGFGMASTIDIFTTSPILDEVTAQRSLQEEATQGLQEEVGQYRLAIETFVKAIAAAAAASGQDTGVLMQAITADIADGVMDDAATDAVFAAINDTANWVTADAIKTLLETESTGLNVPLEPGVEFDDASSPDSDQDGVPNDVDDLPQDPDGTVDSDGDGVGDSTDAFPNDPSESADSDEDGVGDNADAFPNDATETVDSDGDGVGNNGDAFPNDANESADSDGDGVGDNADAFPNDASESADSDGDGVGDNADAFPNDPTESVDSDEDGVGDNADAFPNDPTETADSDGDGVGDNADAFPNDAGETVDSDGDGVGDNGDAFPTDPAESADSDGDSIGDNADPRPNDVVANYHADTYASGFFASASQDEFSFVTVSNNSTAVSAAAAAGAGVNALDLGDDGEGDGTFALAHVFDEVLAEFALGDGCTAGVDCTTAQVAGPITEGPVANDDPETVNAILSSGALALDFAQYNVDAEYDAGADAVIDVETDLSYGLGGTVYAPFGQSFVGTKQFEVGLYPVSSGGACATDIILGAFTDQPTLDTAIADLVATSTSGSGGAPEFYCGNSTGLVFLDASVVPAVELDPQPPEGAFVCGFIAGGNSGAGAIAENLVASANCSASGGFLAQGLSVYSPEPENLTVADLTGLDYGLVEFSADYSSVTQTALMKLNSSVSELAITDGLGAISQANISSVSSAVGSVSGTLAVSAVGSDITGITVNVAGSGEIAVTASGGMITGFAANDLELLTLAGYTPETGGNSAILQRGYAVQLDSGVVVADLNGQSYNLQGVVIETSTSGVNMLTYQGATLSFAAGVATLAGDITSIAADFADASNDLPAPAPGTVALGSLVSDSVVVADNGRLIIAFIGSNLELEGFYSADGLLLRLVDGAEGAVASAAQGVLFGTN